MHSIKFLSSIFATLSVALPQGDNTQSTYCASYDQLNVDIFNPGKVTERICTNDGSLVYGLKTVANFDVRVVKDDLANALNNMRQASSLLEVSNTLAANSLVQNLHQSCQGEMCVTLGDTPNAGQGWTAGNINDIASMLHNWVVSNQDPARIWIGTSFGLSRKDGTLVNFATGCFAPKGKEGQVPDCVQPAPMPVPSSISAPVKEPVKEPELY